MSETRQIPEGLTKALLSAVGELRQWVAGPPAPDAQVRAWRLYSGWEYGGVYCAEPDCGCAAEGSELIAGAEGDEGEDDQPTFTLDNLHRAIGEHVAFRADRRAEETTNG